MQMESQLPNDVFWKLSKFQFLLLGLGVEGREDKAARDPAIRKAPTLRPWPRHGQVLFSSVPS